MSSMFIADGYTIRGRVPAAPPFYPAVEYVCRPAAVSARYEFQAASNATDRQEVTAAILCRHLVSVRPEGDDGPPVQLKPEQAKKLYPGLFMALFNVVMGYDVPELLQGDDEKNSGPASGSP